MSNPFDTNTVCFRFNCNQINASRLSASALRSVDAWNKKNQELSSGMLTAIEMNNVHIPALAEGFAKALTFLPAAARDIPHISAHDSLLSAVVERVNRKLPDALMAYFLHIYFVHHGYTAEGLLKMDDVNFTKEMFNIFSSPTRDAAFNPYQPDRTLDLGDTGGGLVTTEDIGNPIPHEHPPRAKFEMRDLPPLAQHQRRL